jgi:hypothetical protein
VHSHQHLQIHTMLHQLLVRSALANAPILHHVNDVKLGQEVQLIGDHHTSAAAEQTAIYAVREDVRSNVGVLVQLT